MRVAVRPSAETCFFEQDPDMPLLRRAAVEGVGTLLLVLSAAGSGLTSQPLFHQSPALGLVAIAVATAGALVGLILAFGSVSGGHFNPLITGLQWLAGERKLDCTFAYIAAQLVGGSLGALLANTIFNVGGHLANPPLANWTLVASEVIATAGLMIVVFGCSRSGRIETGPFAAGAWLSAAIIATPSTSYANPAIALAAVFAGGPIALSTSTALLYVPAEVAGALVAFMVVAVAYPRRLSNARLTPDPVMASTDAKS
jgi:glycerol uptake facilitator-like aquaporin